MILWETVFLIALPITLHGPVVAILVWTGLHVIHACSSVRVTSCCCSCSMTTAGKWRVLTEESICADRSAGLQYQWRSRELLGGAFQATCRAPVALQLANDVQEQSNGSARM